MCHSNGTTFFILQQLTKAQELCMKAYGEKHLLACRLYLNIGILYEDNRDYQEAYDYFVRWNDCCMNVSLILAHCLLISQGSEYFYTMCRSIYRI